MFIRFNSFTTGARLAILFFVWCVIGLTYAAATGQLRSVNKIPEVAPTLPRIDHDVAIDRCESTVMTFAKNKSSVKFLSPLVGPRSRALMSGSIEVKTRFSAKNDFGSEMVSVATCNLSMDGKTMNEFSMVDSR